ncbi:MAG: NAD+ synthase [Synechococcus sp. TMED187]|nr:MAG: NAD+ synthase [Synechococcus sp. TMED187]RZO13475.1 MAG: NAD+ synthase [Synechococcus sp. MED-G135]|tara:strand:+ start:387 stop:2129 length:1743 start_codon:yes stop_codon:yes gene_type:complete
MRIALAQLNPFVGDLAGNANKILQSCRQANGLQADLVVTPELGLWGYPPRDLLLNRSRVAQQQSVMDRLSRDLDAVSPALGVLVGLVDPADDGQQPRLFNAVALIRGGQWQVVGRKQLLPSYDVFDESRYFRPASAPSSFNFTVGNRDWQLGLSLCEDLWVDPGLHRERLCGPDPIGALAKQEIDLLLNLSASPFGRHKQAVRHQLAQQAACRLDCPVVYVNQVGGNDELVFDGASFVMVPATDDPSTKTSAKSGTPLGLALQLPSYSEELAVWEAVTTPHQAQATTPMPVEESLFRALVLGVCDYAGKCGFDQALLGLSGGIDSALVAVIAAAALGADQVEGLLMPSPWSSKGSIEDAEALASRLGLRTHTVPISALMASFDASLTPVMQAAPANVTAENLQSRIRGTLLMAVANQQGQLLLSTGNKSELAVGYCTLYGDMNGGLAVIGDLYKSTVFALCNWLDSDAACACRKDLNLPGGGELVGRAIREKPPSAELRPDQKDSDSLPDYAVLDPLLRDLIEERCGREELLERGHPAEEIDRVQRLFRRSEFKRRQAAPLLKVSSQAFGTGWRLPIAAS